MTRASVFLDTNFLVASQIEGHIFYPRAKELLSEFAAAENVLVTHNLVFDELWYVSIAIWRELKLSKNDLFKRLNKATTNVFNFLNFALLETVLTQEDLVDTLKIMKAHKLRPRDAMILEIMKKEKITKIASFDNDFTSVKGIKVVN